MQRRVSAQLTASLGGPTELLLAIAVADGPERSERLSLTLNGAAVTAQEVAAPHGGRLHLVSGLSAGEFTLDYSATVDGVAAAEPPQLLAGTSWSSSASASWSSRRPSARACSSSASSW